MNTSLSGAGKSITKLRMKDKIRLRKLLDEQMAHAEENTWEDDPIVQAEIQEARNAYPVGDYVTIDEYITQRRRKN
jgi:hypothetical protein